MKRRTKSVAIRMQIQHNVRYETFMATGCNDVSQEISHEMKRNLHLRRKALRRSRPPAPIALLQADSHTARRAHATTMPFPCHAVH